MPVFEATDAENPPLHMDGWDDDELVYLKPHVTHLMDVRARGKAVLLPDGMTAEQLRAMPEAEIESLVVASTDNARIDEQLLLDMVERWTLRRQPTRAQRAKGERGDVMPLNRGAIAQLPPAVGRFLRAEIDRRRDVAPPEALIGPRGDDFRSADDLPHNGRLPGPGESAGAPDGPGVRDHREDALGAGGGGPGADGAPGALPDVLAGEG